MLVDRNHQLAGTHTVERRLRFSRPAFIVTSVEDFRSVVRGACGLSGGRFCHLIPVTDGRLSDIWSSYIRRLLPDSAYVPAHATSLKPQMEDLITGLVMDVDYARPIVWGGTPYLHSLLAERDSDGSPSACGPSWLVDVERSPEAPPLSELQAIARFGLIPELVLGDVPFLGVRQQLRELVHTVPPAPGQGLVEWLLEVPRPDPSYASPGYLDGGGAIHSAITLNLAQVWAGGQSYPPHSKDLPESLANRLVVVGDDDSLEDACMFWNLRANRLPGFLPTWVTPEQATMPEVRSRIATAARRTGTAFGHAAGADDLHLVSATMDTRELAASFADDHVVGWTSTDWIRFIDRRHRPTFSRSKEVITFEGGQASLFIRDDALPCPRPTQITVDLEIGEFRPAPTRMLLFGTNGPDIGRFGEAVLPSNHWTGSVSEEEVSLGYPQTLEIVRHACERAALRPSFDRKAALTYGLNRILDDEYSALMILRSRPILDALRLMIESEQVASDSSRYLTPRGTPFGVLQRVLGTRELASALVSWLLKRKLLFRGLELECADCGTRAWYSLNDMGNLFQCVGCQAQQPFDKMPHDASWRYRVNQLLGSALDQGVLQQILAAHDMDLRHARGSRAHVFPNVILADANTGDHTVEIDLLGFINGQWVAAECKASGTATSSELERLRGILERFGGGLLVLVRASTASDASDQLADQVLIWDHDPIRREPVDSDDLLRYLDPG